MGMLGEMVALDGPRDRVAAAHNAADTQRQPSANHPLQLNLGLLGSWAVEDQVPPMAAGLHLGRPGVADQPLKDGHGDPAVITDIDTAQQRDIWGNGCSVPSPKCAPPSAATRRHRSGLPISVPRNTMLVVALVGAVPLVVLSLLLVLVAGTLVVLRTGRHHRAATEPGTGSPTGSGRLAYEITVGVVGLLVGGMLTLAGLWWIVIGVGLSSVLFYSPQGALGGGAGAVVSLVIGLILGGAGVAVVVVSRSRLLRL